MEQGVDRPLDVSPLLFLFFFSLTLLRNYPLVKNLSAFNFKFSPFMSDAPALRLMFRRQRIRSLRLLATHGQDGLFFLQAVEVLLKEGRRGNLREKWG